MFRKTTLLILLGFLIQLTVQGQTGYVVTRAKDIKDEHAPKPKDFKTKALSWGLMDSDCRTEEISHGTWFKIYPKISKLKITVSTGFNWGDITDPYVYIGYLDTINGLETLVEAGCEKFYGDMGDFTMEVNSLRAHRKHYLLIGGDDKGLKFALHLTNQFDTKSGEANRSSAGISPQDPNSAGGSEGENVDIVTADSKQHQSIIIGRIRHESGDAIKDMKVMLLNDDLEQIQEYQTDAYGQFRFQSVNPDKINLIKLGGDDSELIVDMFLYSEEGNVVGKPIALGHRMHSFRARKDYFNELAILSQRDVVVDVDKGNSSMTGKVVDKQTYLIGREGIEVGLYSDTKNKLRTTQTDMNGKFTFTQLEDREYIVKVEHDPKEDYVEIVLADDMNVPYASTNSEQQDSEGYFKFKRLPEEVVELRRMEVIDESGSMSLASTNNESPEEIIKAGSEGKAIELKSIEFATASSKLHSDKNTELDQLAKELKQRSSIRIKIDGHTDNVGSEEDNMRLSNERAEAVKAYLVSKGVSADRIECEGFGSGMPLVSNDSEEGRSKNRRVEFTVQR